MACRSLRRMLEVISVMIEEKYFSQGVKETKQASHGIRIYIFTHATIQNKNDSNVKVYTLAQDIILIP